MAGNAFYKMIYWRLSLFAAFVFSTTCCFAQIDSILFASIKNCNVTALEKRLLHKIDINGTDKNGANALAWAAYYCDLSTIKCLFQHGAKISNSPFLINVNYKNNFISFSNLPEMAASIGKLELLQYFGDSLQLPLSDPTFDPCNWEKKSFIPLIFANKYGHTDIAKYLLQKKDPFKWYDNLEIPSALLDAAKYEHWDIFDLLINNDVCKKKLGEKVYFLKNNSLPFRQNFNSQGQNEVKLLQFVATLAGEWYGSDSPGYAFELVDVAELYINNGKYEYILTMLEEARSILKTNYGDEHAGYAKATRLLSLVYNHLGKYNEAIALCRQAVGIIKKKTCGMEINYAIALNNLAFIYKNMGQYEEALQLYLESFDLYKKITGENSVSAGGSMIDIAYTYVRSGQYKEALPLFQQTLLITKAAFGESHPWYALILDGIALIYERLGDYNKAQSFYRQSLNIRKIAMGEDHPYYARSLKSLATVYMETAEYDKALYLYQRALAITEKSLTTEHPHYAELLSDLARVYKCKEQYDTAFQLYMQCLAITKKTPGTEHPGYTSCLANMALLYAGLMQYDSAMYFYNEVLAIREKSTQRVSQENVPVLNGLALLHIAKGNPAAATLLFIEACNLQLAWLSNTYSILSEQEKITFLNKETYLFNYIPSALYTQNIFESLLVNQAYQNELSLKGMILEDQEMVLKTIRKSSDSKALMLYKHWRSNKSLIGKQLLLPSLQRMAAIDSLKEATNQLEQQLSMRSAAFQQLHLGQNISVKDIHQKLLPGQAAIEFIRFPLYNRQWTDSIMYAAMIVLPGDSITEFVPLFEEKQLQRLLQPSSGTSTSYETIKRLYGTGSAPGGSNDSLYNLVWKPLEKYLKGIHTIAFAPAGLLHRVAFQALQTGSGKFLIDKYQLRQMLSTRSIITPAQSRKKISSVTAWGNVTYSDKAFVNGFSKNRGNPAADSDKISSVFNFYSWDTRSYRGNAWQPLPGTKQELDSLKKLFLQKGIQIAVKTEHRATEEAFKAMDGRSPQVIHLATHGFFLPVPETAPGHKNFEETNPFTIQHNPMFRSGLVLAGGNKAWEGKDTIAKKEDGILTAYEIAQLDFSNTDLVVLSACGSGLGDLQGNEGAFGLQRAFKLAGVQQMITSLWPVPDVETAALMTLFYRNWLNGATTRESLKKAQLTIKETYPSPFFWAAFVVEE